MLDDFKLRVFVTLIDEKSFTETAHKLNISQPAVSQNIADLEKTLHCELFEKRRNNITLSDKGRLLEDYARTILHWYDVIGETFRGEGEALKPTVLEMVNGQARIWTSGRDLHIRFIDGSVKTV